MARLQNRVTENINYRLSDTELRTDTCWIRNSYSFLKRTLRRRIFIALDLSDDARNEVARHIAELRSEFPDSRIGWERVEKLHITLRFLGETDDSVITRLQSNVVEIASKHSALDLRLGGPGVFPIAREPRVLWIAIKDRFESVRSLYDDVQAACESHGFERERRSFKAHVTIGRVRSRPVDSRMIDRHLNAQIEPVGFRVATVNTYESRLQPTGSVYSVIAKANLRDD